jgi:hypothetical protein
VAPITLPDAGLAIVSIGDFVREGAYRVHSRFRRAVNLMDASGLVSLVAPAVGAGPLNIVVRGLVPSGVERIRVFPKQVDVNETSLAYDRSRVYSSRIELEQVDFATLQRRLPLLGRLLVELAPPKSLSFLLADDALSDFRPGFERTLALHVSRCVKESLRDEEALGIERLLGCGFGLTPSGDDFVAGALTAVSVFEQTTGTRLIRVRECVLSNVRTSNIISDTLLSLAAAGRVCASVKSLIAALGRGTDAQVRAACQRVLAHGSTSGADFTVGLCLFLRSRLLAPAPLSTTRQ